MGLRSVGLFLLKCAASVSRRSREEKLDLIRSLVPAGSHILAIGVEGDGGRQAGGCDVGNYIELHLHQAGHQLTALAYDVDIPETLLAAGVMFVRADGTALPFRDGAFDVALSNAVVEHVGGAREAAKLLDESRRVSRRFAVHTTPNRWFPVETHTLVPLVHWLPRACHHRVLRANRLYRWRAGDFLFSRRQFGGLSPGGRVLGGWPATWPITLVGIWPAKRRLGGTVHGSGSSSPPLLDQ